MRPTIEALAGFAQSLEAHYRSIPAEFQRWAPASWDGFAGERFTGIEHLCHVRDIEIDGYHVRFRRALSEENPTLDSIEGYELAQARNYSRTKDSDALASFRAAREETLLLISALRDGELGRPAVFEGNAVTVRGLVHHLCKHDYLHLAGLQWLLAKLASPAYAGG
jgi:DinB superfamily